MAKSTKIQKFLKSVKNPDTLGFFDKQLIQPIANQEIIDMKAPVNFLMYSHPNMRGESLKNIFRIHNTPDGVDKKIEDHIAELTKPISRKQQPKDVKGFRNKLQAFVYDTEKTVYPSEHVIFNGENGIRQAYITPSFDDGNDYVDLYQALTNPPVLSTARITLGELLSGIFEDDAIKNKTDHLSNETDTKDCNKLFTTFMSISLLAKAVCMSTKNKDVITQSENLDKFIAPVIMGLMPLEYDSSKVTKEVFTLTKSILDEKKIDYKNVRNYFMSQNVYDITRGVITGNYRCSFSNPKNNFVTFDENGFLVKYFRDSDKEFARDINGDLLDINTLLDNIKNNPGDKKYIYSLLNQVAYEVTNQPYDKKNIKEIDLDKDKSVAAKTLIVTLNLLHTIENDIDPSHKDDFEQMIYSLAIPIHETTSKIINKEALNEEIKAIYTSNPEISAVPGISDMFTPKAVLKYPGQPLSIALNWLEKAIKAKADNQAEDLAFASSKDPDDEIKNSKYSQIHKIIHKTKKQFAEKVQDIDPNDPLVATKMTNDQFNNIIDNLQVGRGKNKKDLPDNVKKVLRVGYNYCCQYAAQIYSLGTAYSKDAEKQLREQFNQGLEDTKDDKGNNIQGVASQMLDGLNS